MAQSLKYIFLTFWENCPNQLNFFSISEAKQYDAGCRRLDPESKDKSQLVVLSKIAEEVSKWILLM
jgi:hypothetical protein